MFKVILAVGAVVSQVPGKARGIFTLGGQQAVHYDDTLPPEAVDQARREFSARTGTATGSVEPCPDQRGARRCRRQKLAAEHAEVAVMQSEEEIMLAINATEADCTRVLRTHCPAPGNAGPPTTAQNFRQSRHIRPCLRHEMENRRARRWVKTIRELHTERVKQQNMQLARRADLVALNAESARMLARYRELRAEAAARAAASP